MVIDRIKIEFQRRIDHGLYILIQPGGRRRVTLE